MEPILLYHAAYQEIRQPDVRFGRKNADFGQGFYLSPNGEFAGKWAKERGDSSVIVNTYELQTDSLEILRFNRDEAWFDYIFRNRAGYEDAYPDADVIIGPIANDTIYDTLGILTSGYLSREQALALLQIGPLYEQYAVKTEKAAAQLHWLCARSLSAVQLAQFRMQLNREEERYQRQLAEALGRI